MATTTKSFAVDIKPYFSQCYRAHMQFIFDLWSLGDVQANWQDIYDSVERRAMPRSGCPEGVWDDDTRNKFLSDFTTWKNGGFQP